MAQPKPRMSITLPRSSQSLYTSHQQLPQTPAPQPELSEAAEPPPPPKQTFKVRRRRNDTPHEPTMNYHPLPSIEPVEASRVPDDNFGPPLLSGYLAPRPSHLRLVSPPRTPASQVTTYSTDESLRSSEWSMIHNAQGQFIERPRSACSDFSDSSASSFGSSNLSRSRGGGSCTSPESDTADPFSFYELKGGPNPSSTLPMSSDLPTAKRVKTSRHPKWTTEMDTHLWITYMVYVQDPRVTPFKMLPFTSPPLGVCHRVAREAKRSWKSSRASQGDYPIPRISIQGADSPNAVGPSEDRSTPTPADFRPVVATKWPRSEAATRRRLREICKRKPSLSAHYMRLLDTRSPSPFESSSSPQRPAAQATPDVSAAFSSRDMNVSLAAATAPSMQADGPLAQLFKEHKNEDAAPAVQRPTEWFNRIGRSQARAQAHQKSQSLQLGLGLSTWSGPNTNFERGSILASPFDSDTGRNSLLQDSNATQSLGRGYFNHRPETSSSFNSPPEFRGSTTVRSLKRRFGVDDDSQAPPQMVLQNMFATPRSAANKPNRHRGFSLGDVGVTTPNIASFFAQPSTTSDALMEEAPEVRPNTSYLATPRSQEPPRLGSPFAGGSSNSRFNTFPRCFSPQEAEVRDMSFEERLRQLSANARREM